MLINDHRQVLYKGREPRMFQVGEEIPEGYFDTPDGTEWKNRPVQPLGYAEPVQRNTLVGATEKEPEPKTTDEPKGPEPINTKVKYPSDMDKDELIEFGKGIGVGLDRRLSRKTMLDRINTKIMEDPHATDNPKD